ncbi:MAG TPA: VOC family protein [Candidatus Kapabacteria bacterium]|nr:VOC family protein [Candidatus Kapabacteria bacterium]
MAVVRSHAPGNFSWFELATTDQDSAKQFYSKVFGWEPNDSPMGEGLTYTMLKKEGNDVGALYKLMPDELAMGLPPHWRIYVTVDNAEDSAKKAEQLGATLPCPPFDVMEHGRMAIVQDPTGAVIMLWEPKKHPGAGVIDEPNAFCWYELNTNDTEKAKDFYSKLFGWDVGGSPEYTEWKQGSRSLGGMMKIQPEWGPMPPNWTPYIMVESADQYAEKIKSNGGNVMMGPADIPNTGRFAIVSDPQGAVFALYEPLKK